MPKYKCRFITDSFLQHIIFGLLVFHVAMYFSKHDFYTVRTVYFSPHTLAVNLTLTKNVQISIIQFDL